MPINERSVLPSLPWAVGRRVGSSAAVPHHRLFAVAELLILSHSGRSGLQEIPHSQELEQQQIGRAVPPQLVSKTF